MDRLKKYINIIILLVTIIIFGSTYVLADEASFDFSASVTVKALFKIDLDKGVIDFGRLYPGDWKNIGEGSYYNQVTCQSNSGKIWYLTIKVLNPLTGVNNHTQIPNSKFKYMPGWTDGTGTVDGQYTFKEFSSDNTNVYTSSNDDAMANQIHIQFQYGVAVPDNAAADDYTTSVVYTMMEVL